MKQGTLQPCIPYRAIHCVISLAYLWYNVSNYGRRAFSYTGIHAWNLLAENVRKSTSIAIFKRSLKTFLFEQITHSAH